MKKHRLLLVGAGSTGERHLRCFLQTRRVEAALCEANSLLRHLVSDRYEVAEVYERLEDALDAPRAAAVVAMPAPHHIPVARQLLATGCHLLIEQPLSVSLEAIDEFQRLVEERQASVAIGYTWRHHPAAVEMRAALESGNFGRPLQLIVHSGQNYPAVHLGFPESYCAHRELGGGAIQESLSPLLNLGQWLVGPITCVAADAAHLALAGVDVEDTVHVLARHGQVLASYSLSQHQAPDETTITLVCQRGTLRTEAHLNRWRWIDQPQPQGTWQEEEVGPYDRDDLYTRQAHAFLDMLEGNCPPACSLAEGIQTLRVNLAVLRAADSHTWQEVTPAA